MYFEFDNNCEGIRNSAAGLENVAVLHRIKQDWTTARVVTTSCCCGAARGDLWWFVHHKVTYLWRWLAERGEPSPFFSLAVLSATIDGESHMIG